MDTGFRHFGFSSKPSSNAFKNLGNVMQIGGVEADYCTDTTLRLDSPTSSLSYFSALKGRKRKWNSVYQSMGTEDGSSLLLGIGRSPSSSESKGSVTSEEETSMDLSLDFDLHLGNEITPSLKKPANTTQRASQARPIFDLELSLSTGPTESYLTSITSDSTSHQSKFEMPLMVSISPLIDEETTTCPWKLKNIVPPLHILHTTETNLHTRVTSAKICQFEGCGKGARGSSGLCIAHGGGRRCQKAGCHKGAEGRTVYCKAHGGGRRCQYLGCTKSAEGRTEYCIAHGGGRRCSHEGCGRAARGKSGLCIRHGGGKRCQMENCSKSAEGFSGFCISHGGGRRCQFLECSKGAQGSTMFCKAHGGGKRCTVLGCPKGAEGSTPFCKGHGGGKRCSFRGSKGEACPKSVHGGTLYCVAHGGGKRCAVPECTKSARGRTDFCVRHGGGKRCKFEGCNKSAQGSTDFCKAHGGGKRCSWVELGLGFGGEVVHCDRFARGKTGLCAAHAALVEDKRVHRGGTVEPGESDVEDMNVHFAESNGVDSKGYVSLPEGRVHGGSLMALLAHKCM